MKNGHDCTGSTGKLSFSVKVRPSDFKHLNLAKMKNPP